MTLLFFQDFQMPPIDLTDPNWTEIGVFIFLLLLSWFYSWVVGRKNKQAREEQSKKFESSLQTKWEDAINQITEQRIKIVQLTSEIKRVSDLLEIEMQKNRELNIKLNVLQQQLNEKDKYIDQLLNMIRRNNEN